jgi:hypothetical protein
VEVIRVNNLFIIDKVMFVFVSTAASYALLPVAENEPYTVSDFYQPPVSVSGINGNKRRLQSLKGSKVGANESERSLFFSIYTAHVSPPLAHK